MQVLKAHPLTAKKPAYKHAIKKTKHINIDLEKGLTGQETKDRALELMKQALDSEPTDLFSAYEAVSFKLVHNYHTEE